MYQATIIKIVKKNLGKVDATTLVFKAGDEPSFSGTMITTFGVNKYKVGDRVKVSLKAQNGKNIIKNIKKITPKRDLEAMFLAGLKADEAYRQKVYSKQEAIIMFKYQLSIPVEITYGNELSEKNLCSLINTKMHEETDDLIRHTTVGHNVNYPDLLAQYIRNAG